MPGTVETLNRSFHVLHTCLHSGDSNFTSGYFLGMITNPILQLYYHIVVLQCSGNINLINDGFQVFSGLYRQHYLKCS